MSAPATGPTDVSPLDFIDSFDTPRRREHGRLLLDIFGEVTGAEPVMWGPSMVGYGALHYKYPTGWEGDMFRVGFSPRKASLSLYGLQGTPGQDELLANLGKYKTGAACVYVNKPEDIDVDVLKHLLTIGWTGPYDQSYAEITELDPPPRG